MNVCTASRGDLALERPSAVSVWLALAMCALVPAVIGGCDGGSPIGPDGTPAFAAVESGEDHTCGLSEGAVALCWGLNQRGQLGDLSNEDRFQPAQVASDLAFRWLSAGISHTCGITTDGLASCWGRNAESQLGDNSHEDRNAPAVVSGNLVFVKLSAGGLHTCGLTTPGTAYCWGSGAQGQLGSGSSGVGVGSGVPTPVSGELSFETLDVGGLHSCGITKEGTLHCWGSDSSGALGTTDDERCDDGLGNLTPCSATPVPVSSARAFASVSAGVAHTCAVTRDAAALCWGRNVEGQLGDGSTVSHATPVTVTGDLQFIAVSAGNTHSCGVTMGGDAYCWGGNHRGQLGDGSVSNRTSPSLVVGELDFVSVSAGGAHTCGLTTGGAVYCWGQNADGELGVETTSDVCINVPCSRTPVRVR